MVLLGLGLLGAAAAVHQDRSREMIMIAIFLASTLSSIAGFAFSAICGGMLFHLTKDPVQVVQVMITCSIANQIAMTWAGRHNIDWRTLWVYLTGGCFGVMAGVWVLLYTDHVLYTEGLGLFLMANGTYMLLRKPIVIRRQHAAFDFGVSVLSGVAGGAAGFPSALVTIWCSMKGWSKENQRAVVQPFILIMQIIALSIICLARSPQAGNVGFALTNLLFIPASLFGTAIGLALYERLSDIQFARAVNVLLIVSGLSYLV